jgi:ABC-type transport system involved in cytochrome c biogenesis permease subunit
MWTWLEGVTRLCFVASYSVALLVELIQLAWPRPVQRLVALGFGIAGLFAHTVFLLVQQPSLAKQFGSMLLLAWVVAVFYLYGSIHHRKLAWAVFVLPVVLALLVLAGPSPGAGEAEAPWLPLGGWLRGEQFWGQVHGVLLLLAAVGVCVAFVASLMYLVQAHQLRAKKLPSHGLRLLSLERLEEMNRRAINWAFPLLSAGVLLGVFLMIQRSDPVQGWSDPKILGAVGLWLVFVLLLYLRYGYHLRGRRLAQLTIAAFVLLLVTLVSAHTSVQGGAP